MGHKVSDWVNFGLAIATVAGAQEDRRDIDVLGAGTARWVAASVRLACQQLATSARIVIGADGNPVTNPGACASGPTRPGA
jgi:hypothetical protein